MFRITYLGVNPVYINGKQLNQNDSTVVQKLDRVYKKNDNYKCEEISLAALKAEIEKKKNAHLPKPVDKKGNLLKKPRSYNPPVVKVSDAEEAQEFKDALEEAKENKVEVTSLDDDEIKEIIEEAEEAEVAEILERDIPDPEDLEPEEEKVEIGSQDVGDAADLLGLNSEEAE